MNRPSPRNAKHNYGMKAKKGTLKRLLGMVFKKYKFALILSFICLFFAAFSGTISSIFMKNITNAIEVGIISHDMDSAWKELIKLFCLLGGLYAVGIIASFTWNRTMAVTTQKFLNDLRKEMFEHMESLPIKYFDTHAHGDIMSLYTNDTDTIRQLLAQSIPSLFQTSLGILAMTVVMSMYSLWMMIIVFFGAIFMTIFTKKISKKSSVYFRKQQQSIGAVEGMVQESIKGLKVIKVFNHEEKSKQDFNEVNTTLKKNATRAQVLSNIIMPVMSNVGIIMYAILAILGTCLLVFDLPNYSITGLTPRVELPGIIFSFLMMSKIFTNNVIGFANQITFIIQGTAGASRIFDLLDEKPEVDDGYVTLVNVLKDKDGNLIETNTTSNLWAWKYPRKDGTITYTELQGNITLTDVDFSYEEGKPILKDISVWAKPGQQIAFVGATGAGKTTITNLINRFYQIEDGKIRYDGININKIKLADLRRSLGIVLQDTSLFTGTVFDNIRYGRLDATDDEVIQASKLADAYDFIVRLPDGFNTVLSGDGSNLSQGQRQLLSIARAAVKNAPVMILDEATSSIDTRTEKLVQNGMDQIIKGRTSFVIAHRLSTVHNSDAIIVLDHGEIIERGPHEELINMHGVYYQLYTGAFELE